eukprot:3616310-Rhodomonas_salina.2
MSYESTCRRRQSERGQRREKGWPSFAHSGTQRTAKSEPFASIPGTLGVEIMIGLPSILPLCTCSNGCVTASARQAHARARMLT